MVQGVRYARDKVETPPGTPDIVAYLFMSTLLGCLSQIVQGKGRARQARQGVSQTLESAFC
jgi:hypothetical protein